MIIIIVDLNVFMSSRQSSFASFGCYKYPQPVYHLTLSKVKTFIVKLF